MDAAENVEARRAEAPASPTEWLAESYYEQSLAGRRYQLNAWEKKAYRGASTSLERARVAAVNATPPGFDLRFWVGEARRVGVLLRPYQGSRAGFGPGSGPARRERPSLGPAGIPELGETGLSPSLGLLPGSGPARWAPGKWLAGHGADGTSTRGTSSSICAAAVPLRRGALSPVPEA